MDQFIPNIEQSAGLCFIEPADAIRTFFSVVGEAGRFELLTKAAEAWAAEVPAEELELHYGKAVETLNSDELEVLSSWYQSVGVIGVPSNRSILTGALTTLSIADQRQALKIVAGMRSMEAIEAGMYEEDALSLVLGMLSDQGLMSLAAEVVGVYTEDRLGSAN